MFLATTNQAKRLLYLRYSERVDAAELERAREELAGLLAELPSGFRLLADFTGLEAMAVDCAEELGHLMDLVDAKGVSTVVRVIPDPKKDIGMNILTLFHYRRRPRVSTCAKLSEAAKRLGL
jgi:hypothetical protein